MSACTPASQTYLMSCGSGKSGLAKRHKFLQLHPTVEAEHASSRIDCGGLAKDPDAWIGARIRQREETRNVEPILARYQHRGDAIPYPKNLDGHGSCVEDAPKAPCNAEIILLTRPFIRCKRISGNIQLIRIQQTNEVQETGKSTDCVGAAAEAKQINVVLRIMLVR
jgi:hypothetical protein